MCVVAPLFFLSSDRLAGKQRDDPQKKRQFSSRRVRDQIQVNIPVGQMIFDQDGLLLSNGEVLQQRQGDIEISICDLRRVG